MEQVVSRLLSCGQQLAARGATEEACLVFDTTLAVDPENVEALLWCGALTQDPSAAIDYLKRAQVLRPGSKRVAKGLAWAEERLKGSLASLSDVAPLPTAPISIVPAARPTPVSPIPPSSPPAPLEIAKPAAPDSASVPAAPQATPPTADDEHDSPVTPLPMRRTDVEATSPVLRTVASNLQPFPMPGPMPLPAPPESTRPSIQLDLAPEPPKLRRIHLVEQTPNQSRAEDAPTPSRDVSGELLSAMIDTALTQVESGDLDKAITTLEEAWALSPESFEVMEQLGVAYYRANRLDSAERVYSRMLELSPDHAEAHANLGLLFTETGRHDQARASYRRALDADPGLDEVRLALADSFLDGGNVDGAVAEWRVAADRNPSIIEFRVKIGDAFSDVGRYEEAAAAYAGAIERATDDPSLRLRYGRVLRACGRAGAALEQFREACRGPLASADAYVEVATTLLEVGREPEAVEALEQALAINPNDQTARDLLRRVRPWGRIPFVVEGGSAVTGQSKRERGILRGFGLWR